jgi:NAD+ synthase (glutamine-hydrolysing)
MRTLRIGLAQINATVGDLDGNVARIVEYARKAREQGVDLVAFPELAVTGYPPEDLLLRRRFILDNLAALERVIEASQNVTVVAGFVDEDDDIYNAAAVIHDGRLAGVYHKRLLPNYGVFDEDRYFQSGTEAPVFEVCGVRVGVNICEDIWHPDGPQRAQALAGAEVIVNISCSPYYAGKRRYREEMLATRATDSAVIVCYVNLVGGQDELVFDGGSMVVDGRGEVVARAVQFEEELLVCDLDVEGVHQTRLHDPRRRQEKLEQPAFQESPRVLVSAEPPVTEKPPLTARVVGPLALEAEVYAALVAGTRDYVSKVGFETVLVGLSGGIDSSLVASVAVDALGADHVVAVSMPSRYSSEGSVGDSKRLAENLGIELMIVPIEPAHAALLQMLERPFGGDEPGTAEENVQARVRGNVLMALSNKFGWLVLATGNKSELATGYCTLYGDMAGGFAVIKDVPKTLVYRLAEHRNRLAGRDLIPRSVVEKPPSAELRPDQLDTDSLPPYEQLDPIIEAYAEEDRSLEEIVALGHDEALVRRVMGMVDRSEYKRRQAPPGVKITPRAFGRDRRLPIANHYRGY